MGESTAMGGSLTCSDLDGNQPGTSLTNALTGALGTKFKNPHSSKCPGVIASGTTATSEDATTGTAACTMAGAGYTILTADDDAETVTVATITGGDNNETMTTVLEIE